jgi:ferritin-like metal-binding protein YciE
MPHWRRSESEHYEISAYGTLRTMANVLGNSVREILEK